MFKLSARSRGRLLGVHPHLVKVVERAITVTTVDFSVVEGLRNIATQRRYFLLGKSKTMNSRHLPHGPDQVGHAVDLCGWVNGTVSWEPEHYAPIADAMKSSAYALGIDVEWGGDWRWIDMPHFQLSWGAYP
jgi:peptidoglycan LD-endopeptidase CwlK